MEFFLDFNSVALSTAYVLYRGMMACSWKKSGYKKKAVTYFNVLLGNVRENHEES